MKHINQSLVEKANVMKKGISRTHVQAQSQKMGSPPPQPHPLQNLHHPRRARRLPSRNARDSVEGYIVCSPRVRFSIGERDQPSATDCFLLFPDNPARFCGNFFEGRKSIYLFIKLLGINIPQRTLTYIFRIRLELISSIRRLSDRFVGSGSCVRVQEKAVRVSQCIITNPSIQPMTGEKQKPTILLLAKGSFHAHDGICDQSCLRRHDFDTAPSDVTGRSSLGTREEREKREKKRKSQCTASKLGESTSAWT